MSAIPTAVAKANKTPSLSDPAYVTRMAPLTLAQDRLARGQNPGPSGPPSSQLRTGIKSPARPRVYLRLPGCYHKEKPLMEPEEEPTPGVKKTEMWEESQRRHKAAVILGSWEMTTWHSVAGNEVRLFTTLPFPVHHIVDDVGLTVSYSTNCLLHVPLRITNSFESCCASIRESKILSTILSLRWYP